MEHRIERERLSKQLRNANKLLRFNPPAVLYFARANDLLRFNDSFMILLLHCALSFFRNGVTGAFGVDCNEEAPDGAIESCCTMKNLAVITRELPSSLVCGRMLDNVACVNVNGGRCNQIVPGYHPCAKTTAENGEMSAEITNLVVLSLMKQRRKLHGVVGAFGRVTVC